MAIIIGTEGADTLQGVNVDPLFTIGNDNITALGGDDLIIGSTGRDAIDGGDGNDTIDFSSANAPIFLSSLGDFIGTTPRNPFPGSPTTAEIKSDLNNVEIFVGNPNFSNTIYDPGLRSSFGSIDVDLSLNKLEYYLSTGTLFKAFTVKNFDNILAVSGNNRLAGNDRNNNISGGIGADVIFGSKGNDNLEGARLFPSGTSSSDRDTLDYSNLGNTIVLSPKIFSPNPNGFPEIKLFGGSIDKGTFGKDNISNFQKIVGAIDKANTIDVSTADSESTRLDVNLANNSLKIMNVPDLGNQQVEVVNFVNVVGGKYDDTIVGSNKNSKLTGGGGNDTITGGTGNDRITGTDSTFKGVGEVDKLTGGGGKDKFVIGDRNAAYYLGNGANDYANITDFNLFQDSIDVGSLKDYSFGFDGTGTVDLFAGKDITTRDLVAKIQIADLGLVAATKGTTSDKMASVSDGVSTTGIDVISSKIDIVSGGNSMADAII